MKYRKLRIAWSAAWGLVALLLIALWVRSYWVIDCVGWTTPSYQHYRVICSAGECTFMQNPWSGEYRTFYYDEQMAYRDADYYDVSAFHHAVGIYWMFSGGLFIGVSFAWFVLFGVVIAAWPWVGLVPSVRRFSLRTLLIATTLVALGLGLIVWLR
jgi:hypothetical protein